MRPIPDLFIQLKSHDYPFLRSVTRLLHQCLSTMLRLQPSRIPAFLRRRDPFSYNSIRFTSTNAKPMRFGFVGIGQMGYPMALNLLRKSAPGSSFTIYDVNPLNLSRFVNEASSLQGVPKVHVAHTPKDVAARSVPAASSLSIVRLARG